MADEPENLVLVYLRRLDEKADAVREDLREVKDRLGSLERQVAGTRVDWQCLQIHHAAYDIQCRPVVPSRARICFAISPISASALLKTSDDMPSALMASAARCVDSANSR
jgi:hypothetical protein